MSRAQSWVKAHTRRLHDPNLLRLSWSERGIWWAACLLSKEHSDPPGLFIANGKPMQLADIALAIHAATADEKRLTERAFRAFVANELMTHDAADGYEILNWADDQSGTATEGRDAWKERKRRQRDRDRKRTAPRRAAGDNIRPIRGEP